MYYLSLTLSILLFPALAIPATLSGRVLRVDSGNTVTVVDPYNVQHTVRLQDIQTPGLNAPEGLRSKEALERMVAGRHVVVDYAPKTGYGSPTGRLFMKGEDVNLRQLREGMALFEPSDLTHDKRLKQEYEHAQRKAEKEGRGIWHGERRDEEEPVQVPPPPGASPPPSRYPPLGDNPRFNYTPAPRTANPGPREYAPLPDRRRVPYGKWAMNPEAPAQARQREYPPAPGKQEFSPRTVTPGPMPPYGPYAGYPMFRGPFPGYRPPLRGPLSGGYNRRSGGSSFCPIGW